MPPGRTQMVWESAVDVFIEESIDARQNIFFFILQELEVRGVVPLRDADNCVVFYEAAKLSARLHVLPTAKHQCKVRVCWVVSLRL